MDDITTKEVKFVNDPKNLSALAKIHEMSNKAKERRPRKSPTHINHIRYEANLKIDNNQDESNFARRKNHFSTMRYPVLNILKSEGIRKNYINKNEKADTKGAKIEYVWDKNLNKLVEKKVPNKYGLDKIEEKEEKDESKNTKTSEKGEILKKLKDYKKSKETDSGKKTDIVYEKRVVKEGEIEDENNLEERLYLVIDYASKGDLFYYIKVSGGFKELYAKVIFKKILEDIQYCHQKNICHLDIKIANILLNENFDPKIADFGLSQEIADSDGIPFKKIGFVGTPSYMCPQMLENVPYLGIDADIFSLGCILFNLVTGNGGFGSSYKKDDFYTKIKNKNYQVYWNNIQSIIPKCSDLSEEFKDLYLRMVSYNPMKRPRINEILNDPWMKEINEMNEEQLNELNQEIAEEFMRLENKMNSSNEMSQSSQNTENMEDDVISRGMDLDKTFGDNIVIKKIKKGDKFANHSIKIKGNIDPIHFMNLLMGKIKIKYEDDCIFEIENEEKLKLEIIFEIIGYIGTAFVLLSFLMTSVVRLRVLNTIGSLVSLVYLLIRHAYPTAFMNAALVVINVIHLARMYNQKAVFALMAADIRDSCVTFFIEKNKFYELFQTKFNKF